MLPSHSTSPLISVIIPAYNAATTVGGAISGVLTQTHSPIELLVVDDGSSDDTARIVEAYGSRLRLIRQVNGGVAAARNTALRQASGQFIAWLDADDLILPRHLERALARWTAEAERSGDRRVIVTCDAWRFGPQGVSKSRILPRRLPSHRKQRWQILQSNFSGIFSFYPRDLHENLGLLDEKFRRGEDRELWSRALFNGWRIAAQPVPTGLYRHSEHNLSSNVAAMAEAEMAVLRTIRAQFADRLSMRERDYLDCRLRSPVPRQLIRAGDDAVRAGLWTEAQAHLSEAATLLPDDRLLRIRATMTRRKLTRLLLARRLKRTDDRVGPPPGGWSAKTEPGISGADIERNR